MRFHLEIRNTIGDNRDSTTGIVKINTHEWVAIVRHDMETVYKTAIQDNPVRAMELAIPKFVEIVTKSKSK